ncbi:MAG: pyridine nucleotide-disulfide oxidoreductase, partial [Deltaproteobacteria bacterium]|nr:pyridine nucleotide-disulfide oxidoreductase [Deltaproteobacteria bacterium]
MAESKNLILAGGGHAHLLTLANLDKFIAAGHRVTVVQPSPYHYYSGMGPGLLGGTCRAEEIRFATQTTVEKSGGRFINDKAVKINPAERTLQLASGAILNYDLLSLNTGSYVPTAFVKDQGAENIFPVKPIE